MGKLYNKRDFAPLHWLDAATEQANAVKAMRPCPVCGDAWETTRCKRTCPKCERAASHNDGPPPVSRLYGCPMHTSRTERAALLAAAGEQWDIR